jgi:hypothetical protein
LLAGKLVEVVVVEVEQQAYMLVVGNLVVGSLVVGNLVVGSLVVGSLVVGSLVVGSLVDIEVVGSLIAGIHMVENLEVEIRLEV